MTAMALDVRELNLQEIDWVSGGEETIGAGPKEVKPKVPEVIRYGAGFAAGTTFGIPAAIEGATYGARIGVLFGPIGFFAGAAAGAGLGYLVYKALS